MESNNEIVKARIYPGIGIGRVGNSQEEYLIGPEVPYATSVPTGGYKDASGALKRQAARFRIFGYNGAGQVVKELTAEDAEIKWTVHVANRKAAWYNFELAMDIPEAKPCRRRNASFTGEKRKELVIDPGPRSIQGMNQAGKEYWFDSGKFMGQEVYLGELRTEEKGNLLFLGGRGASATPLPNNSAHTFANNDGWHDDTSDGPVSAEVKIAGRSVPVEPAWVVVAPPNYAPDIITPQTMYDVLFDAYQESWIKPVARPSFTRHIYPVLRQFCEAQWVNFGFHVQFGWDAPHDFLRPAYFSRLASAHPEYAEVRLQVFNIFRNPDYQALEANAWPQLYGDASFTSPADTRKLMALTPTQYGFLRQWAAGNFEADWNPHAPPPPQTIEEVKLEDRPDTLDRAALYFCMGGPFHPGCEMTWPMRHRTMYSAPFRVRPRAPGQPEPDYGDQLTLEIIRSENGPLYTNGPGDITRWMAVPWQTDTASCRSGYDAKYDPYLPTFWPARVPNHVLSLQEYQKVIDSSLPVEERMLAFNTRATWYRGLEGAYLHQINQMVSDFGKLGIVERRELPQGDSNFPPVMYVESQPGFSQDIPTARNTVVGQVEKVTRHQQP